MKTQAEAILIERELLQNALENLYELKGERGWWKDEPRCGYAKRYKTLCDEISHIEMILSDTKP